ncbi:sigma-70 family RNA polymerase sigma factor [Salinimicrobium terrae]|uniref:sigma-70 family RNA polymerase sigma factor n=1 Tax=Salinimicrobium terrae TaxID=470866 RepID=UPI00048FB7E7|nr:sigma-70 family RNA polymerase sigma factor [Salinimicrobium terrae]
MQSLEDKIPNCDVPALWLEHRTALKNYILKRVKDQELANDILQEVLLKVYKFCLSNSGVRNVRSWLYQIAHNTMVDYFRKESKKGKSGKELEFFEEDENLAFKEALEYIQPLISFLPPEYAVPLRMADLEGMKQAEIAQHLNLSLTATKSRIQRARTLLKAEFITCCHLETDTTGGILFFSIKDSCTPLKQISEKN